MDEYPTRREFDQLSSTVMDSKRAIDELRSGNTAIAVLGTQLASLTQSVSEMKSSLSDRFEKHDGVHSLEAKERVTGRRWLISMAIAGIGALIGLYGWIAIFIHK